jgi:ABC-type dipeptide/oligopeptide/nickel transport system ATPase component
MLLPGNGHSRFPGTNLLLSPIYKRHAQIVGDAGSGKSVLTKQIFAALAQNQVEVLGSWASPLVDQAPLIMGHIIHRLCVYTYIIYIYTCQEQQMDAQQRYFG